MEEKKDQPQQIQYRGHSWTHTCCNEYIPVEKLTRKNRNINDNSDKNIDSPRLSNIPKNDHQLDSKDKSNVASDLSKSTNEIEEQIILQIIIDSMQDSHNRGQDQPSNKRHERSNGQRRGSNISLDGSSSKKKKKDQETRRNNINNIHSHSDQTLQNEETKEDNLLDPLNRLQEQGIQQQQPHRPPNPRLNYRGSGSRGYNLPLPTNLRSQSRRSSQNINRRTSSFHISSLNRTQQTSEINQNQNSSQQNHGTNCSCRLVPNSQHIHIQFHQELNEHEQGCSNCQYLILLRQQLNQFHVEQLNINGQQMPQEYLEINQIIAIYPFLAEGTSNRNEPAQLEKINFLKQVVVDKNLDDQQCSICYENYTKGEIKTELPCSHTFHSECVHLWLNARDSCPICRQRI